MLKKFRTAPTKLSHAVVRKSDYTRDMLVEVLADGFIDPTPYFTNRGWKLAAACIATGLTIDDCKSRWSEDGHVLFLHVRYDVEDRVSGEQIRCTFTN